MKTKSYLLIATTLVSSVLFYEQSPGINYLLFTLVMTGMMLFINASLLKRFTGILVIAGALITGFNVMYQNTLMAVLINWLSLIVMIGLQYERKSSFLIAFMNACFSLLSATLAAIGKKYLSDEVAEEKEDGTVVEDNSTMKLLAIVIPVVVASAFVLMYMSANPRLANYINFDFISGPWVTFNVIAFLILFGAFYPIGIQLLTQKDISSSNKLSRISTVETKEKMLAGKYEYRSGVLLFSLLNIILIGFHASDIYFLSQPIPVEEFVDYLHQGVDILIFSIIFAIAIILYYFRGRLNFKSDNKTLKRLAYTWIFLNAILVLSTAFKNLQYINEFGLTYRRIGVYIYLLLTLIGLVTTLIKVFALRNNWYLFRVNTLAFYVFFVVASFINWDKLITDFNFNKANRGDLTYLIELTDKNLPELLLLRDEGKITNEYDLKLLESKLETYESNMEKDWPSWNLSDQRINEKMKSYGYE